MASEDEERIRRWVDSGGTVEIADDGPPTVVSLRRCDGGEEMDRLTTADPAVIALVERLSV